MRPVSVTGQIDQIGEMKLPEPKSKPNDNEPLGPKSEATPADEDDGLSLSEIFDICSHDGSSPGYLGDGMWIHPNGRIEER
jgi:hypothetical protein